MTVDRPPISPLARLVARVLFAFRRRDIEAGDRVAFRVPVSYGARLDRRHLAYVPAGVNGVVRDVAPMPGCAGGAIVDLLDGTGRPSGYWTGAMLAELRRVP